MQRELERTRGNVGGVEDCGREVSLRTAGGRRRTFGRHGEVERAVGRRKREQRREGDRIDAAAFTEFRLPLPDSPTKPAFSLPEGKEEGRVGGGSSGRDMRRRADA